MKHGQSRYDPKSIEELKRITSIGELTARILIDNDLKSVEDIKEKDPDSLTELEHLGWDKSNKIIREINEGLEFVEVDDEILCPDCSTVVNISDEKCPECNRDLSLKGSVFLSEGVLNDPLSELAKVEIKIMEGVTSPELWYKKGAIFEALKAYQSALDSYDKVIELDPLYNQIWTTKANICLRLGRIKDAAKAYKVAVNKEKIKLPAESVEGIEEEERKEFEINGEEVENKLSEARSALSEVMGMNVTIDYLNSKLHQAVKARNRNEREKAVKNAEDVIRLTDEVKNIEPLLNELDDIINESENIESYISDRESINNLLRVGDFEKAEDISEGLIRKIESEEGQEETFNQVFDEAKRNLAEARDTMIDVSYLKEKVKEASDKGTVGDFEEGIERGKEAIDISHKIIDIDDEIRKGKELVSKIKGRGLDYKEFLDDLKEAKERADNAEYDHALDLLGSVITDMEKRLERLDAEEEFEDKLANARESLADIRGTNLDIEELKDLLSNAVKAGKDDEFEEGLNLLDGFLELYEKLSKIYEGIKEGKDKVKTLKENDVDFKRYVRSLKRVKQECDDENYGYAQNLVDKVNEKLDEKIEDVEVGKNKKAKGMNRVIKKEELSENISKEIKDAKKRFKESDKEKEEISEMIKLLREAKRAENKGDMKVAFRKLKEYQERF